MRVRVLVDFVHLDLLLFLLVLLDASLDAQEESDAADHHTRVLLLSAGRRTTLERHAAAITFTERASVHT